ncbi:hypothetical protein HNP86_001813 [Methanococcus maripaludis]|uniref:Uncharacterized protein n=1 Tax=Methanococcus maripaludis TaxID=39152 RepID=A0A7J9NWL4_METMI|nr:hypothetical protein [Methanococcus maripaludis]MBA2851654.1 hypothetical protein [Methanococcus maripaludis]
MYTVKDVAEAIRRDTWYVSDLCKYGKIHFELDPSVKIKKYLIPQHEFDKLLAEYNELKVREDLWEYKRVSSGKYIRKSKVGLLSDKKIWYSPTGACRKMMKSACTIRKMCADEIIECVKIVDDEKIYFYINEDIVDAYANMNKA